MLQSIRDHTQGWIAGVIISLLILSFALWGISSYIGGGSANVAVAKVDGTEITKDQLNLAYERLRRQMQMQGTNDVSVHDADLREKALQSLINVQVLSQASLAQKYRISFAQVDNLLRNMPEFQVNGQFSSTRLQQILAATLFNAKDFLDLIQSSLLIDQPRLGLIFTSFALPDEIEANLALVGQEREIQYVVLPFQGFTNQIPAVSQEEIKNYYQEHESDFKKPEQVSIEYIELSINQLMAGIAASEQDLRNYFNENPQAFADKSQKVDPIFENVKEKVKAAFLRQQAMEKLSRTKEKMASITYEHPDSLAPAAKELSLKIQASELFTRDKGNKDVTTNAKVREIAFSDDVLTSKNNSDLIQISPDTIIVLRIKSHTPATTLPLNEVEKQIEDKLKLNKVEKHVSELANELAAKLRAGTSLDAIAKQYNLKLISLGFTGRHSNGVDSAILDAAFAMPKPQQNHTYSFTKVPSGVALISVNGVRESALSSDPKQQYKVFGEQIQNTQGILEYELYKQSMINKAKIVVNS